MTKELISLADTLLETLWKSYAQVGAFLGIQSRRFEEELLASEAKVRGILETAADAIITIDQHGVVRSFNAAAERIFGYSCEEVVGRNVSMLMPSPYRERHDGYLASYLRTGESKIIGIGREVIGLRKDGSTLPMELALSEVSVNSQRTFTGIARDISERKKFEAQLASARDAALDSARLKAEFLANMSHEIRTPMNGIIGMTGVLIDTQLDEVQREATETIRSCGDALLTIINDILDLSKIEAGKMRFETIDFGLRPLLESIMDLVAPAARAKSLELASLIHSEVPDAVRGDPVRIRQVLTNIIANAIKFTASGEVILRVTMDSETDRYALIRMAVRDTGIGIPSEARSRLFQPFAQADGSTTRQYGGTGLGLAISKGLVERMGGEIGVESEPGKGSTFWFTARLEKQPCGRQAVVSEGSGEHALACASDAGSKPVDPPQGWGPGRQNARILLVEDNQVNQRVTLLQLRKLGYTADVVSSGAQALGALERADYDLVLMDCQMPEMDGYDAAREIRKREGNGKRCAIIAITAHALDGDRDRCLAAGMDDYISKPVDMEDLRRVLERWSAAAGSHRIAHAACAAGSAVPSLVDEERLMDITDGDTVALGEVIELYFRDTYQRVAELRAAIEMGACEEVARIAHMGIGSSATCGMVAVTPVWRKMESLANEGKLAEAAEVEGEIQLQLERMRAFIEERRAADGSLLGKAGR